MDSKFKTKQPSELNREDLELLFGRSYDRPEGSSLNLSMDYILDSNGRLRYLYPSDGRFPAFLRFLNISTFRGKVISLAVRLFFRLKMSFLLKAGSVTVFLHGRNSLLQVALKEHLDNFGFCIFFGTYGPDRKLVVEVHDKHTGQTDYFVKIPLGSESTRLVNNEQKSISFLAGLEIKGFSIPQIIDYCEDRYLILSSAFDYSTPPNYRALNGILDLHSVNREKKQIRSLRALSDARNYLEENNRWSLFDTLSESENASIRHDFNEIVEGLLRIAGFIGLDLEIDVSFAHKDFTPWNSAITDSELYVIDWERAESNTPIYYDFCHYIYQSEIMFQTYSSPENLCNYIIDHIDSVLPRSQRYGKEVARLYFACYIIDHIFYRIDLYSSSRFPQIAWQITAWRGSIDYLTKLFDRKQKTLR